MAPGGAVMKNLYDYTVKCDKSDCHGNAYGRCTVLAKEITGKACPFYKSKLRLFTERAALKAGDWEAYYKARRID